MRYPNAIWVPGPAWKVQGSMVVRGVTGHSAVGYAAGLRAVLMDGEWAWHFSVLYDGTVWQHYDSTEIVPHGHAGNGFTDGIEHEGGAIPPYDEPLRPAQLAASIELVRWLSQVHSFPLQRGNGLWQHDDWFPKLCPVGRIPWHLYTYGTPPLPPSPPQEEEPLNEEDRQWIVQTIDAVKDATIGEILGGELRNDINRLTSAINQHIESHGGAPVETVQTYTVIRGDTLGSIAARFSTTPQELAAANGISDPNLISVGQVLRIP